MDISKIILKTDFLKLNKKDADKIIEILDIEPPSDMDIKEYLFNSMQLILKEKQAKEILLNKIFSGKTSVKWYKIHYKDNLQGQKNKISVIKKLESEKCSFNNIRYINTNDLKKPKLYICIKLQEEKYLMRFMIPSGTRTYNDGQNYNKVKNINNVIVLIDLKNEYIEIRTNSKDANKIANIIKENLPVKYIEEIRILKNYNNSLEKLKESLNNGQFTQSLSIPDYNLEISEENNEMLIKVLLIIDDYFINKDIDKFCECISELNIDTDGTSFTQLLLSGMAKIGIKINKEEKEDLSQQTLYKILKKYITTYSGSMKFCNGIDDETDTMLVGTTTNSIFFKSSVSEKTIAYIRQKVL